MTTKPNDVRVSRELLERMRQRLIDVNQIADFGPELFEILNRRAQPADQQGEPVGYTTPGMLAIAKDVDSPHSRFGARTDRSPRFCVPLYLHAQPATAKVVMPERLDLPARDEFESADQHAAAVGEAKTWNACLDEVAKLNTPQ